MTLTLKVELHAGENIHECAEAGCVLADRILVCVEFNFNGITCWCWPNTDPNTLYPSYLKAIKKTYLIAQTTRL